MECKVWSVGYVNVVVGRQSYSCFALASASAPPLSARLLLLNSASSSCNFLAGSLEVKLPTIWKNEK